MSETGLQRIAFLLLVVLTAYVALSGVPQLPGG